MNFHSRARTCPASRTLLVQRIREECWAPTEAKVERMIQTLLREWAYALPYPSSSKRAKALKPWLAYHNRQRPHAGLGHQPPITRLPSAVNNPVRLHS